MKRYDHAHRAVRVAAMILGLTFLPVAAQAGPHITFQELQHDWGEIDQGSVATYSFDFVNDGDAPLELYDVQSSCECTVPTPSAKKIPAGGNAQIDITFDSERFTGNVTKEITVTSNDPTQPEVLLHLYATVRPGVLVEPATVEMGVIPRSGGAHQTITLTASDGTPFQVKELSMGLDFLSAHLTPESDAAKTATRFTLDVTSSAGATPGPFTDFLQIATTHPTGDSIQVMVRGEVESLFKVEPERISFGTTKGKDQKLGEVMISYLGSGSIKFIGTESSTPGLRAELDSSGREAHVDVFMTDKVKAGRFSGTITVKTDNPEQPTLPVRVVGYVRG